MPVELKSNLRIPSCVQNIPEIRTPKEIKFSSNLPNWCRGTIWITGPGTFDLEKGSVKAWLDGFAMVTKMELAEETVTITSKHLHTTAFKKAVKAKHPVLVGLFHPPAVEGSKGFFSKLVPFTPNDLPDQGIGVIHFIDSKCYHFTDSHSIVEINPKTLATIGSSNTQKVFGLNVISPLILKDNFNGDEYIVGSTIKTTFHNSILRMPASNRKRRIEERFQLLGSIPSRWKFGPCGLRKSFALTESYVIFIETPAIVNLVKLGATYLKSYRMFDWIDYVPQDKTRFYIMRKEGGRVLRTEYLTMEGFIVADIINAYEDNDKIILDICTNDMELMHSMNTTLMRSLVSPQKYVPGSIHRYTIPIITCDVKRFPENVSLLGSSAKGSAIRKGDKIFLSPELISHNGKLGYDNGTINPEYYGKKHEFFYVTALFPSTVSKLCGIPGKIVKVGCSGPRVEWDGGAGHQVWKPLFIPNPAGTEEDDGLLVALISNLHKRHADFLVVINAKDMKEVARAELKDCPVSSYVEPSFQPHAPSH